MKHDWAEIQRVYDTGADYGDLRRMFGVCPSTIDFSIKRGRFIPRAKGNRYGYVGGEKPIDHIDWMLVQKEYDDGKSERELCRIYHITRREMEKAVRRGLLSRRPMSETVKLTKKKYPYKASEATKEKLRKKQLELIDIRPELSPIHYHSSKKSFPEKIFEDELRRRGIIGWKYNLPVWKYRFDFAFTEEKIDVEVDGSSHLEPKVADKDRRRDEWSVKNGWTVVRFTATRVKTDLVGCVSDVEKVLASKRT